MPVSLKRAFFLQCESVVKYAAVTYCVLMMAATALSAGTARDLEDFLVNDDGSKVQQSSPSIAVTGDGSFAVAWVDRRHGTADIFMQRYTADGTKDGRNFVINDNDSTYQFAPSLHTDIFSRYSAVWIDYREGSYPFSPNIFTQAFDTAATPVGPNRGISLESISSAKEAPDLSLSNWGRGVVVWADNRNGNWDIYGQLVSSDGSLIGGNFLVNDDTQSAQQHAPKVSSSPEGWFVVTWYDNRLGDDDVFVQRFDTSGNRLGVNVKVNSDAPGHRQSHPDVATDGAGHFTVVWVDWRNGAYPSNPDIYSCRFDTFLIPVTENILVNGDGALTAQREPAIAADRMGNVAIIWSDSTQSSLWDITGQMLDVSGLVRENNFRANIEADSIQLSPSVALDGEYRYVAWSDYRNGNFDIFASVTKYNDRGIVVAPPAVNFMMASGGSDPDPITLTVNHSGYNPVNYHVTGGANWLTLSQRNGTTPSNLTVGVNTDTLPNGTYLAQLTFVDDADGDSTTIISVRLDITSPVMALSEDTLYFVAHEGIAGVQYKNITISNLGQGSLNWKIISRPYWVSVNPDSGSAPATVSLAVEASIVPAGDYLQPVIVGSPGGMNIADTVWLKLTVLANTPEIMVSPNSIYALVDASQEFSMSILVSNIGGGSLSWSATTPDYWLKFDPSTGSDNETIHLSAVDSLFAPGLYTGSLTVADPSAYNLAVTIPIIMEVSDPADTQITNPILIDTLIFDSVDVGTGVSANLQLGCNKLNDISELVLPARFDTSMMAVDSIVYDQSLPSYLDRFFAFDNQEGLMRLSLASTIPDSFWLAGQSSLATIWFTARDKMGHSLVQPIFDDTLSPTVVTSYGDSATPVVLAGSVSVSSPTSVTQSDLDLPGDFELKQNYPNPFNQNTIIEYSVPYSSQVELEIFNILGQKVVTLVDGKVGAGNYSIEWNGRFSSGREAPSGIYFYRFRSGQISLVQKMVLLK